MKHFTFDICRILFIYIAVKKLINQGYSLFLTLDIAKMYAKILQLDKEVFEFYREYNYLVREVHIHDYNEQFGSHQMVGTGMVDFELFKEFIQKDDVYNNFEIDHLRQRL